MKRYMIMLAALLLLGGCQKAEKQETEVLRQPEAETGEEAEPVQKAELPESSEKLSAWMAYWDLEQVEEELLLLEDGLSSLSCFEAYFDGAYQVVLPEGFLEDWEGMDKKPETIWLTVVNDVVYGGNCENSLKDTEVLRTLFDSSQRMEAHVEELVQLAKDTGVDGIEIDYENIREDMELWKGFEVFAKQLSHRLEQEGLGLRIVLETQTPFADLTLPKEAEYVVMCYNLHGGAGDIGAKADEEFLKKVVKEASVLPGTPVFALATGGFDWWDQGGQIQSVTEQEALGLQEEYGVSQVIRDEGSYALHFQYEDKEGRQHEVWYGDGETIGRWRDWVCETQQYPIAIWRLGGNTQESIELWQK